MSRRRAPANNNNPPAAAVRRSRLARENNISPTEESEILEAFSLFSEPSPQNPNLQLLPIPDFRRALIALGIPPSSPQELTEFTSILDPDSSGFCEFEPFLQICAIKLRTGTHTRNHQEELDEAYALFTGGRIDAEVITLANLRRVARLLRQDEVTDEMLRDMILEANGGAGVNVGVRKGEFDGVMRRAGVWR